MNLAFWTEAHKRGKGLLLSVSKLEKLVREQHISDAMTMAWELRGPSEYFRELFVHKEISCESRSLLDVLLGVTCMQFALEGWRIFNDRVNDGSLNLVEFVTLWHFYLAMAVGLLLKKCRQEAAPTN